MKIICIPHVWVRALMCSPLRTRKLELDKVREPTCTLEGIPTRQVAEAALGFSPCGCSLTVSARGSQLPFLTRPPLVAFERACLT